MTVAPRLHHVLPLGNENRWSDLLAVLIDTDPQPMLKLLDVSPDSETLTVQREHFASSSDRPDLVLLLRDRIVAVVEVKVLSDLGPRQLGRYEAAVPDAESYVPVSYTHLTLPTTPYV